MDGLFWAGIAATIFLVATWYALDNGPSFHSARFGRTVCYESHVYYVPSSNGPDE